MVLKKIFAISEGINGKGAVLTAWSRDSSQLAMVGAARKINVVDRQGRQVASTQLPTSNSPILIDWGASSTVVAVAQEKSSIVVLFYPGANRTEQLETGLKDITTLKWARNAEILAVGNDKGGMMLYVAETMRKIPVTGRHVKKVTSLAWGSLKNWLAVTGEDNSVSISDGANGEQIDKVQVSSAATQIQFASKKTDARGSHGDSTLSMALNKKTLLLYQIQARESMVELTFNPKYGDIVSHSWYGDGYIVLGFQNNGQISVLSSHPKEMGAEISTMKSHEESQMLSLVVNSAIHRGASLGANGQLRLFDVEGLQISLQKSEMFQLDEKEIDKQTSRLDWSDDGQILTVTLKNGGVQAFMTRLPSLSAGHGSRMLHLASLNELSVKDVAVEIELARIAIEIEPTFAALSDSTVGIGMNNMVIFFSYDGAVVAGGKVRKGKQIEQKQYPSVVDNLVVSREYAAAIMGGKALLSTFNGSKSRQFPERQDAGQVVSHALTTNFYIYGTSTGLYVTFSLTDFQVVCEYKHSAPIKSIWPNTEGTRAVIIDHANQAHVLNPVTEMATQLEAGSGTGMERFIWDCADSSILVGIDSTNFTTFVYSATTRFGPTVTFFRKSAKSEKPLQTVRPLGFTPTSCYRGTVFGQSPSGTVQHVQLQSHVVPSNPMEQFRYNLQLNRLEDALALASTPDAKKELADKALHLLDVNFAIRVFRSLNVPATVMALERIVHVQEKNLLMGHICAMFKQFNEAQHFFTRSSAPYLALEMRRDLLHWDQALQLAETLAEDQVPALSKESGQQYEFKGDYSVAKEHYLRGMVPLPSIRQDDATSVAARDAAQSQNDGARAGAARCLFRMGNIRDGMVLLEQLSNKAGSDVFEQCATILEELRQFEEAARMYERAGRVDDAVAIYVRDTKNMRAAQQLLPRVRSRNVLTLYAKAKEEDSQYAEAAAAYDRAEDWDSAVRIRVEFLNDLPGAYRIVRLTRSAEAAAMVANVCRRRAEYSSAIEFLLLARQTREAFNLAKEQNVMSAFETALLQQVQLHDGVAPQSRHADFRMVAEYYDIQQRDKPGLSADYYLIGADYEKALERYAKINTEESINKMIEVVSRAKSDRLTARFMDYLQGEADGEPKDPKFFFKLYMALKNYDKVAKTALIIAGKEQELGNYRAAHKMLVDTILLLQQRQIRIGGELRRALMLVHSYVIVKHLMSPALDDHQCAARMLLRVARNIAKFPVHEGILLASTVIECTRSGFKASAMQYATQIWQSDKLRLSIPEKSLNKVNNIIRKRTKEELSDPTELTSLCPFCQNPVEETQLECNACQNHLPFCIVTGKHMTLEEWSQCPHCEFPALIGPFQKLLQHDPQCPMCGEKVESYLIEKISLVDVKKFA